MKQIITIMKQRVDLSDEEISSYMDFDFLRKMQKEFDARKQNQYLILKWSVPALLLVISVTWFYTYNDDLKVSNPEQQTELKSNPSDEPIRASTTAKDSVNMKETGSQEMNRQIEPAKQKIEKRQELSKPTENMSPESVYAQAEPIQGYASLYTYLNAHLEYPMESLKDSIQGVQTISFIINVDGKPERIQFIGSLGAPFERESKRLIESMPAWRPATLNGKPVPSKLVLPLTFQIQKIKAKE